MSEKLGCVALENEQRTYLGTELVAYPRDRDYGNQIVDEVREIVGRALQRTLAPDRGSARALERAANLLLTKESLDEADLRSIVEQPGSVHARQDAGTATRFLDAIRVQSCAAIRI